MNDSIIWGTAAPAWGADATSVQIFTDWANLAALLINIAIGLGGLCLLYYRIRKARRDDARQRHSDDG